MRHSITLARSLRGGASALAFSRLSNDAVTDSRIGAARGGDIWVPIR